MRNYARPLILQRPAWHDRFSFPDFDDLLAGFKPDLQPLVQRAADSIRNFPGLRERIDWQGIAWRWCVVFTHRCHTDLGWAYLIMKPDKFQIAIPLNDEVIENIPTRRTPKFIKDGVRLAARTAQNSWATWTVESETQLGKILDLHDRKYRVLIEGLKKNQPRKHPKP